MTQPKWVIEVGKEIKRLNGKINRMEKKIREGCSWNEADMNGDLNNWTGWRDALKWTLLMRQGKSTRQAIWAKPK